MTLVPQGPSSPRSSSGGRRGSTDLVHLYLQDIGRVHLLRQEEEVMLARQVQERERLLRLQPPSEGEAGEAVTWAERAGLSCSALRQALRRGQRARERMIQANLRLVVAVAKKYQHRGIELLDLVQEGTLGLERAVERFDPTRGFRFSTYAYWWIRQGVTRALASQSRMIRLPVHVLEKLTRIRRAQAELTARLCRSPRLHEVAAELGLEPEAIRQTLQALRQPVSLELRVGHDYETELGELLEDPKSNPDHHLTREALHADLERLLQRLSDREADVIRRRFGLHDNHPRTLSEIGDQLHLSRERVRQLEARALGKLRQPYNRCRVRDYLASLDS